MVQDELCLDIKLLKNGEVKKLLKDLKNKGIYVHPASFKVAAEEAPGAYKNIRNVVDVVHGAGISKKVVKLSTSWSCKRVKN